MKIIQSMKQSNILKTTPQGFTLLEIIIVIIIVGILASLALPRFLKTVEFSRASEALAQLSSIRRAMERCYLWTNTYVLCNAFTALDIDDPATQTNAHFTYGLGVPTAAAFTITATRNAVNGGDGTATITINEAGTKTGTGPFAGIR